MWGRHILRWPNWPYRLQFMFLIFLQLFCILCCTCLTDMWTRRIDLKISWGCSQNHRITVHFNSLMFTALFIQVMNAKYNSTISIFSKYSCLFEIFVFPIICNFTMQWRARNSVYQWKNTKKKATYRGLEGNSIVQRKIAPNAERMLPLKH